MVMNLLTGTEVELNVPAAEEDASSEKQFVIPPKRTRYLSEIAEQIRHYNDWTEKQAATAGQLQALQTAQALVDEAAGSIETKAHALQLEMDPKVLEWLEQWPELRDRYESEVFTYQVRGKDINVQTTSKAFPTSTSRKSPCLG